MANRGRATFAKRQKEIARQERAREKAAKRVDRKDTRSSSTATAPKWIPTSRTSFPDRNRSPTISSTKSAETKT